MAGNPNRSQQPSNASVANGSSKASADLLPNGMENTPRGRLLAAAAHLFRMKGFERTTVRDLAQEVGIQSGSIFHHFKTKEEILRCVMEEVIHLNTERLRASMATASTPQEKLYELIRAELNSIVGETGEAMAVLIFEWRCLKEDSQQYLLELRNHYERIWLNVLEEAKKEGQIAADRDVVVLRRLLGGALAWSNYWYRSEGKLDIDQLAKQTLYMAFPEGL